MKKIFLILLLFLSFNGVYAADINAFCTGDSIAPFAKIVSLVINAIKIVVPILLIIFGMIDMLKAVMSQKDDEIKKGQKTLISRVLNGVLVFFVVAIVQFVVNLVTTNTNDSGIWTCVCRFIGCSSSGENNNGPAGSGNGNSTYVPQ